MTTFTPNYNLAKPDGSAGGDLVDIAVLDSNFDTIDTELKDRADRLTSLEAQIPSCKVRRAASQSIPNGAFTDASFDTEDYDTDTMFDIASPTQLVVKTAGLYVISFGAGWVANATGQRLALLKLNGNDKQRSWQMGTSASVNPICIGSYQERLAVNDILTLSLFQDSGGTLGTLGNTGTHPFLAVAKAGN